MPSRLRSATLCAATRLALFAGAAAATLGPAATSVAQAANLGKAASAMAANAMKAYEKGDYDRAAELFLNAWRTHPAQTALLYNAARATHLAGRSDPAEALYKQFLEQAQRDPALETKARGYLDELRLKKADAKAEEAAQAAKAGDAATAARLYLDALRMAPERPVYAFRSAQAAFQAGRLDDAEQGLRVYLQQAPTDAPERAEAATYLDRIAEARKAAAAEKAAEQAAATQVKTPPAVVVQPAPAPSSRVLPWSLVGVGAASLVSGGVLFLAAQADQGDLDRKLDERDANGLVSGIGHDEAVDEAERIAGRKTAAAVATGVGVVAAGVGAWLLLTADPARTVLVAPQPGGAVLALRF